MKWKPHTLTRGYGGIGGSHFNTRAVTDPCRTVTHVKCHVVSKLVRERNRDKERQIHTKRDRQTDTHTQRDRQKERQTQRETRREKYTSLSLPFSSR